MPETSRVRPLRPLKPRFGVRLHCKACGYRVNAGGILTKRKADQTQKAYEKLHAQYHAKVAKGKKSALKTERDLHAAELGHVFVEQTTRQTSLGSTYADVTGASIAAGSLDDNKTYLVYVTAQLDCSSTAHSTYLKAVLGSTTQTDSEAAMEPSGAVTTRMTYAWWGVLTPTSGQALKLQFKTSTSAETAGVDLVSMTAIKLSDDLTQNTHWHHNSVTANTALVEDTDTSSNNGSITFTPFVDNEKWLVLTKSRIIEAGEVEGASVGSRMVRSGEASSSTPESVLEGEDIEGSEPSHDKYVFTHLKSLTLNNVSNTFTEKSFAKQQSFGTRTHSAVFILHLDSMRNVLSSLEETTEDITSTTDFGYLIHTGSITPAIAGDVWIVGHFIYKPISDAVSCTARLQVDNTDQPAGQTTAAYDIWDAWDSTDTPIISLSTMENLTAAAHTIDIDGSVTATTSGRGTTYRNIMAVTMELEVAGNAIIKNMNESVEVAESVFRASGFPKTFNESLSIPETTVRVKGAVKALAESQQIAEGVIRIVLSGQLIVAPDFVLRLSGGAGNSSPSASLGGAKSNTAVTNNAMNNVWDDVTASEAAAGDTEYRCLYIHNGNGNLTMSSLKVWILTNTPGQDNIRIGLGTSAINGTEQTIANENTAPTGVGFSNAVNEAAALSIGNLPVGQHKAIWIERDVPDDTGVFFDNSYSLKFKCQGDHLSS